uniref:Chromosome 16 open reading frame 89 n=1 Tax=Astyanax mexicanus TaxID=7994 RepID=A0A3B1KFN1_ASTMX
MGVKKSMSPSLLLLLFLSSLMNCSQQELIDDLLESLSKGVSFFEKQSGNINLDGVVGYVILQAQLLEATRSWPHSDFVSLSQRSTAMSLIKKLDRSLTHAVRSLQQTDPKYYKEFEPILDTSFWVLPQEWSSTDPSLVYSSLKSTECYDEQLGDKCMTLLLGTWKDNGTPCIVTKSCRDTMTRFGCPHYSLSHQLLYFMIGTMKGCSWMLKGDMRLSRINITVEHYQRIFCSNMMKSNLDSISNGITGQIQDIFIENILLCGLAGFSDFYKADWLQHILQWQDRELGCFGKDEDYSQMFEEFLDTPHKRAKRRDKAMKEHCSQMFEEFLDIPHKRVKRREKTLKDGCSSHMTGVAVSTLGGYLNFYLSEQDITKRPLT